MFPYIPGQPGYNRRLRQAPGLVARMNRMLAADTSLWSDDVWVADSTPVECGRSRDTARRSELAGWAQYGYCARHSRYFWGLWLHLLCTPGGLQGSGVVEFCPVSRSREVEDGERAGGVARDVADGLGDVAGAGQA